MWSLILDIFSEHFYVGIQECRYEEDLGGFNPLKLFFFIYFSFILVIVVLIFTIIQ